MALDLAELENNESLLKPKKSKIKNKKVMPWDSLPEKPNLQQAEPSESNKTTKNSPSSPKPITNIEQLYNKPITNQKQTYNIPITKSPPPSKTPYSNKPKPITNIEQLYNKPITNQKQTYNITNPETVTNAPPSPPPPSKPVTNIEQTYNNSITKPITKTPAINRLSGHNKNVLFFIFEICNSKGSLTTGELSTNAFEAALNIRYGTAKTVLNRLKKMEYITVVDYKNGRSGWSIYKINETIYRDIKLQYGNTPSNTPPQNSQPITVIEQTYNKPMSQPMSQPITNRSSSSNSIYINKNTTTINEDSVLTQNNDIQSPGQQNIFGLPEEWLAIDRTPLTNMEIKFGENQLNQIYKKNSLNEEQVQDSIYAFAHELEHNEKNNTPKNYGTSKLNFFMGILMKGRDYIPLDNYESPRTRARREYYEREKQAIEKEEKILQDLKLVCFEKWFKGVDESIIEQNVPAYDGNRHKSFVKKSLFGYFEENVFPDMLQQIDEEKEKKAVSV